MKKIFYLVTATLLFLVQEKGLAQNAIPGNDFEEWNSQFLVELPEGWITSSLADPFAEKKPVTKTTDAFHGKYAVRLETIEAEYEGEKTIMQGFGISGKLDFSGYSIGFPLTGRPRVLSFYYKYMPVENDSMEITIALQRYTENGPEIVGAGTFTSAQTTEEYARGAAYIDYLSEETPDSAIILILSGVDTLHAGSVLYVDYLNFEYHMGTNQNLPEENFTVQNVYPQPASNKVYFPVRNTKTETVTVEITDMAGRKITSFQERTVSGKTDLPLEIEGWKPGMYLYRISTATHSQTGKFLVSGN